MKAAPSSASSSSRRSNKPQRPPRSSRRDPGAPGPDAARLERSSRAARLRRRGSSLHAPWYMIIGRGSRQDDGAQASGLSFLYLDRHRRRHPGVGGTVMRLVVHQRGSSSTRQVASDGGDDTTSGSLRRHAQEVSVAEADQRRHRRHQRHRLMEATTSRIDPSPSVCAPASTSHQPAAHGGSRLLMFTKWTSCRLRRSGATCERASAPDLGNDAAARGGDKRDTAEPSRGVRRLVDRVHSRACCASAQSGSPSAAAHLQFPLEFAALKQNLQDFIGALFAQNNFQEPRSSADLLSSGTQEGARSTASSAG